MVTRAAQEPRTPDLGPLLPLEPPRASIGCTPVVVTPGGVWVEDWRADFRLRWVIYRFRSGPQSGCHGHVSSPRRIERSVRVSRTTLTCALRARVYGTYVTEVTFRSSRRNR